MLEDLRIRQLEADIKSFIEAHNDDPDRAGGRCEHCRRPHGKTIHHLGHGRWYDPDDEIWRNDRGRKIDWPAFQDYAALKQMKVVLAAAHLNHDPTNNGRAICRRSASAVIFAMTGGSTAGARGSLSSNGERLAICSTGPIQLDWASVVSFRGGFSRYRRAQWAGKVCQQRA